MEALSHYWRFPETAETLRQLCPSQVGTWIDHVSAGNGRTGPGSGDRSHAPWPASPSHLSAGSSALDELTPREREVLELMAADRTNDEIAADLFIAIPTVKTHINHIRRKLDQTTRVGAVLEYQRLKGLVVDGHGEHRLASISTRRSDSKSTLGMIPPGFRTTSLFAQCTSKRKGVQWSLQSPSPMSSPPP